MRVGGSWKSTFLPNFVTAGDLVSLKEVLLGHLLPQPPCCAMAVCTHRCAYTRGVYVCTHISAVALFQKLLKDSE